MSRVDSRILPPSIADKRGRAFVETMRQALDDPDFKVLLFERIDNVPDGVLPHLVREFSIEEFVEPDMTPAIIRRLLKASYGLHARKGYVDGVRTGLAMLGVDIASWAQWFQQTPAGAPGTHRVRLVVREEIIAGEGVALSGRVQQTLFRMAEGMKRKSQDIGFSIAVDRARLPVFVGMAVRSRIRMRPMALPVTLITSATPVFVGAVIRTRLRTSPRIS